MLTLAFDESTMSRTQGQEDVNDDARSGRPNTSTTDENIVAVKKMILYNLRITIREVAHNVGVPFGTSMTSNFYGCFCHETGGSEDYFKIAKFCVKTMSHGHRSVNVDDVQ